MNIPPGTTQDDIDVAMGAFAHCYVCRKTYSTEHSECPRCAQRYIDPDYLRDLKSWMRVITEERNAALEKAEKLGLQLEDALERLHAAELRLIDSPVVCTFEKGIE